MTVHFPGLVQIHIEKYNTVKAVPKSSKKTCTKIQYFQSSSKIMPEQFRNDVEKTTLSEQLRNHVEIHVEK